MSKKQLEFNVPINILIRDDGTKSMLIAIDYFRGGTGRYADPSRDAIAEFTREFTNSLSPSERKRFDLILESVQTAEAYRKMNKDHS
jgi:hypothetical protein